MEVDSTFYHPASARNCALWAERTPDSFRFHVKAHRIPTWHDRAAIPDPATLRQLAAQFVVAVEPMRQAGKLVALHFQSLEPLDAAGDGSCSTLRSSAPATVSVPQAAARWRALPG